MTVTTLDEFLTDNHDEIRFAAQTRLRGHPSLDSLARQQGMSQSALLSQVLGFWLQAITTDILLGSTTALEQNLGWLVRLRAGQNLPFEDPMVLQMFSAISTEIRARLTEEAQIQEYAAYQGRGSALITEAFPDTGLARP